MPLTQEQSRILQSADNYNLVCALPGSGKTHTIIELLLALINNQNNKIIAVTFTNAAAAEMRHRVGQRIPKELRQRLFISTFHALLMQQAKRNPDFSSRKLVIGADAYHPYQYIINRYREHFAEKSRINIKKVKIDRDLLNHITTFKSSALDPDSVQISDLHDDFYKFYLKMMRSMNLWSLDMLTRDVTVGLQKGTVPCIQATHLLIDEYQDVDEIQFEWASLHGRNGSKITVVGDDDQSIYGFRASLGVHGMERFKTAFNAKYHTLSLCFRCARSILASAEKLIQNNEHRMPKKMKTASEVEGKINFYPSVDEHDESSKIVAEVKYWNDGAILSRTNDLLDFLEVQLRLNDIEYQRVNSKSMWTNPIIQIFVKLFYSIAHPADGKYTRDLLLWSGENNQHISSVLNQSGKVGFCHIEWDDNWNEKTKDIHRFTKEYCQVAPSKDTNTINQVLEAVGLFVQANRLISPKSNLYKLFCRFFSSADGNFKERTESLDKLINKRIDKEIKKGILVLTTFHGSKGCEWEKVWLAGVDKGWCPLPPKIGEIDEEEERRLVFVAITRAKTELHISWFDASKYSPYLVEAFGVENLI